LIAPRLPRVRVRIAATIGNHVSYTCVGMSLKTRSNNAMLAAFDATER
jgi:hypothetical protein